MICLRNGRLGWGQPERDSADVERARRVRDRRAAWDAAAAAWERGINEARPVAGSHTGRRHTDYPTAVRAAAAAWDKEMSER